MTAAAEGPEESAGSLRQRVWGRVQGQDDGAQSHREAPAMTGSAGSSVHIKPNKTYGRTPDGIVFTVPTTHDMVSQLLDPRQSKNLTDAVVLAILGLHILAAFMLPASLKRPVFAAVFLFWRASYNIGIGYLLRVQSHHRLLVTKAKKWRLFEPSPDRNPRPWLYQFLKRELKAKIPDEDYTFEAAPIEYNTWLVFRRVVDLILMCDFVSYCLFAAVCGTQPDDEAPLMAAGRWGLGLVLVGFNLWVKLDAHRVVKDYAWYWGDFFYLVDQQLTFDGVFEMAPHPMYSVGYVGYYGISMMAHSYDVLWISVVAHLSQLVFLVVVENPHIEKTYNPPPPRIRDLGSRNNGGGGEAQSWNTPPDASAATTPTGAAAEARQSPATVHNLLGLRNIDLFRIPDYSVILLCMYLAALAMATPNTQAWQALFVAHAVGWRLWYSLGLGLILSLQSKEKMFTRHFVKYGDSPGEAWRQWKAMYHLSTVMCHAAFIAACWKMYSRPADWSAVVARGGSGDDWALLKHVLGTGLVALQLWTSVSIYDELGEFGWFYGDFFFDNPRNKLTYGSIYRFLNNPERVMGSAGLWGAWLITSSSAIFLLALTSQLLTLGFISYVEKPHMQKVYGRGALREEAGLTKFVKRSLPPPVKEWSQSVDRVLDEAKTFIEEFVESAHPKLAAGVSTMVRDTTALFNKYPTRLTITRLNPALAGFDPKHYSVSVDGTSAPNGAGEHSTGKESVQARTPKGAKTRVFEYGAPIHVKWTAPVNHSRKDWIGLYRVTDNRSRDVTEVPSLGRWVPTCAGEYDRTVDDKGILSSDVTVPKGGSDEEPELVQGEMVFSGDKLWWTQGVFEFRYHHDGKHNVMSISPPFEVRVGRFDDGDEADGELGMVGAGGSGLAFERAIEATLLPLIQNCLDRDPEIAPSTVDEPFGAMVERDGKYAKRVVYAIHHMFGIEFAPGVVQADGNARKLAWRIANAKQVLAPYSMSRSRGTTTPVAERFPQTP